jgi:RNA polymerase sigma-70 factor (ECF subfamily)
VGRRGLAPAAFPNARAEDDPFGAAMDFLEIHDRYYHPVRKFILATVKEGSAADDLVQETFARIQENLGSVQDPSRLSSWIFRIAHRLCLDHFRESKRSASGQAPVEERLVHLQEASVQKQMEQGEMSQCVQEQLGLLPESLRSVLICSDLVGLSRQEIADILGLSVENVKVRLHRARKKLKAILEAKCTFEVDERNVLICEPAESKRRGD